MLMSKRRIIFWEKVDWMKEEEQRIFLEIMVRKSGAISKLSFKRKRSVERK